MLLGTCLALYKYICFVKLLAKVNILNNVLIRKIMQHNASFNINNCMCFIEMLPASTVLKHFLYEATVMPI